MPLLPDVKRAAALDMYGFAGTRRRRRIIRLEFFAGAAGCIALGALSLSAGSWPWVLFGAWLCGAGLNYIPLALYAERLSRPGALERELAGVDTASELRSLTLRQVWIAVPGALLLASLLRRR